MNAVDVIYAASPVYLYLNPEILGYLLRPLLEYQETHLYPNSYAARDIGMSFPNIKRLDGLIEGLKGTNYSMAIGNNEVHGEGIERKQNEFVWLSNLKLSSQNTVHYIESGNMLIMAYAHAQRTGDTSLISQHVSSPPSIINCLTSFFSITCLKIGLSISSKILLLREPSTASIVHIY